MRAGQAIEQQFALLETNPDIGRPFAGLSTLRELVIDFGDSGYFVLYRALSLRCDGKRSLCAGV